MISFSLKSLSLKSLPIRSLSLPFNLQRREKVILAGVGIFLGLFIIAQLTIFPILNKRNLLRRQMVSQTKALQEMQILQADYKVLNKNAHNKEAQLKNRPQGFTLFSFLDTLAGKSNIKPRIASMKPSTTNLKNSPYTLSTVEMKIDGLTMEQLVTFLHGIESSPNLIWIKRIAISRGDKEEDLINTVLQVETFQL